MKNLIITVAVILLMLSMMTGWFRLFDVMRTKGTLQAAAENGAAAAALCIDEEAFGDGILRFDEEAARKRAEEIIFANVPKVGEVGQWEITFAEDKSKVPSVTVRVWYKELKVTAAYEYLPLKKE